MNRKEAIVDGEYYHVYNRGNDQREIFRVPDDYVFFLSRLSTYLFAHKVKAIAFTLLPNHYHLILIQSEGGNLPAMMGRLATSHAHRFNLRYHRTGHVFQGPYKYKRIDTSEYLVHLARYIHLNPVFAGLARSPEDWPWSNYLQCVGKQPDAGSGVPNLCKITPLLAEFNGKNLPYEEFVQSHLREYFNSRRRHLFDE
jgi:REP element-mobilizing transposase RayT